MHKKPCKRITDTAKERTARNWFKMFVSDDESFDDVNWSGWQLSLNDDDLKTTIKMDSKLTCRELTAKLHSGEATKISKWVSHSLTAENKLQRLIVCSSHLGQLKCEPLFDQMGNILK